MAWQDALRLSWCALPAPNEVSESNATADSALIGRGFYLCGCVTDFAGGEPALVLVATATK